MNIQQEFADADLGDARRTRRLLDVVSRLAVDPAGSFPKAMVSESALEGAYRFLNNKAVTYGDILEPHWRRSAERVAERGVAVVAHDTTEVGFRTPRAGLGRVTDGELGRGFFLHTALAVSCDGRKEPLGVVGAEPWVRLEPPKSKQRRATKVDDRLSTERESDRWWQMVQRVEARMPARRQVIHVMDREADEYVLFARLIAHDHRFVIRNRIDRRVVLEGHRQPTMRHALRGQTARLTRTVKLTPRPRKPMASRVNPKVETRQAHMEICAMPLTVRRPKTLPPDCADLPATIALNIVHVKEINPPDDYEPIDWKLLTTEPIETEADVAAVVDYYLLRWMIEEYFKALKTGCDLEHRQLETMHSIYNALAIFMPIACNLLCLRTLARTAPHQPAETALTSTQILILQKHPDVRLGQSPSVQEGLQAVARLGGHIKNNGQPGWQVLGRGYQQLLVLERGALLMAPEIGDGGCCAGRGGPLERGALLMAPEM